MGTYQHVLVALDLDDAAERVLARAADVVLQSGARATVLNVVKPLAEEYSIVTAPNINELAEAFEAEALETSRSRVHELVEGASLSDAHTVIEFGSPVSVIKEQSRVLGADLIIMGSHGKRGLQLLGSTANGVLHGAQCDVLTVRLPA